MKKIIYVSFIIAVFAGTLFVSCSDSESRKPSAGEAKVIINLGLRPDYDSARSSIIDRIFRIFATEAVAATSPPASFSRVVVRVTGQGMTPVEETFSSGTILTMNLPAGSIRYFDVTAYVSPYSPDDPATWSAAESFHGSSSATLPEGVTVSVPVLMTLYETKIVMPDPGTYSYPNRRIIQMLDMTGAGWVTQTGTTIGFPGTFMPWDIDFDSRGRIYIATNSSMTGGAKVIRLDHINDTTYDTIADNGSIGVVALAIDRPRDLVYFASTNILKRCKTDGTGPETLPTSGGVESIYSITGLGVDSKGMLYIAGSAISYQARIFQWDPSTQTVTKTCSSSYLSAPEDVLVKEPYIYVTNTGGAAGYKILQLDENLQIVGNFGQQAISLPDTSTGMFYGPRRFVAIRNDRLFVVDDYSAPTDYDKLVSFTDMSGTGWTSYPSGADDGQSYFSFFYGC